jgi:hypothetical protein
MPGKKTLKDVDEELKLCALNIANHEYVILGLKALGDSAVPKLHDFFVVKAATTMTTKKSIAKKMDALFSSSSLPKEKDEKETKEKASKKKKINREQLIKDVQVEKDALIKAYDKLIKLRSSMHNMICEFQVQAIKENAAKMGEGSKKDYMKKMAAKYQVCLRT